MTELSKEPSAKVLYSQTRKFIQLAKDSLELNKYCDLVDTLSIYHCGTIDRTSALRGFRRILQKSATLRQRLNQLLPETPAPDPSKATEYIERIRAQGIEIYTPFVLTLGRYQSHEISFQTLLDEAERIFAPYPDLLDEFLEFSLTDNQENGAQAEPVLQLESKEENNNSSHMDGKVAEPDPPQIVVVEDSKFDNLLPEQRLEVDMDDLSAEKYAFTYVKELLKDAPEKYISLAKCLSLYVAVLSII